MTAGTVLLESHHRCANHDSGRGHPERPERLKAVLAGIEAAGLSDAVVHVIPRQAAREELERVHSAAYLDAMEKFCRSGGGAIDLDTAAGETSWDAAMVAAGSGVDAVERLRAGEADAAFVAVRPPGHHATAVRAMGFCLVNNVAVVAASLAASGERVLIVDYDAHHGNGTQDIFWSTPQVAYLSLHEWPQYPGTGALSDIGDGDGRGTTINVPVPAGATGDVYLAALDELVTPVAERFRPTWLVVSAGFDGHRADPLCDLELSAGDYGEITARLCRLVPPGRRLAVLEGGYDLDALGRSSAAVVAALADASMDSRRPERLTNGGPGRANVAAARRLHFGEPARASH